MDKSGKIDELINQEAISKELEIALKKVEKFYAELGRLTKEGAIAGIGIRGSSNISEQKSNQESLNKIHQEAEKTLKRINDEKEKAWKLQEKLNQKAKENDEKKQQKDIEDAMKRRNTESEKTLRNVQKEIDYLKKHGEETVKLTRNVADLKVKLSEAILKHGEHSKVVQQVGKEYDAQREKLTKLQQRLGDHTQDVGRYQKAWEGIKGAFFAVTGAIAAAAGVIKFSKDVMQSTGEGADYLAKKLGGIKEGYHQFMVAIQTGDFSNLVTKMREAIIEGERYIETLDKIRDATTAISVKQAEYKAQLEKLKTIQRDVSKPKEIRQQAGLDALELENKMLAENMNLANLSFQNEIKHAQEKTKLGAATIQTYIKAQDPNDPNYIKYENAKKYLEIEKQLRAELAKGSIAAQGQLPADPNLIKKYREELAAIPAEARAVVSVVRQMNILTKDGADAEVPKLTASWINLYNVQSTNEAERRRIVITQGRLAKGILDESIKEEKESNKTYEDAAKEKIKQEEEFWKYINKKADEAAKEYDDAIKKQADTDQKVNELKLKYGTETADELLRLEMAKTTETAEFALLTAQQKAIAIKKIYRDALMAISEASPMTSTTVAGEDQSQTFTPGFNPASSGTPSNVPTPDKNQVIGKNDLGMDVTAGDAELSAEAAIWNKRIGIVADATSKIDALVNASYQNRFNQLDQEAAKDQENKDRELKAAEGNTGKIKEINARYDAKEKEREKEKRRVQKEQAKYQKTSSTIQAVINTALAVTNALTVSPFILGAILAVLAAATGAAEIAMIQSQPLPSYKKGTKGTHKDELAKVHAGELIRYPSGEVVATPDVPESLAYLPKNTQVIPHEELMEMAGRAASWMPKYDSKSNDIDGLRDEVKGLHVSLRMIKNAIQDKPETTFAFENGELRKFVKHGSVQEEWINNRVMP